jgi:hypothetical protein
MYVILTSDFPPEVACGKLGSWDVVAHGRDQPRQWLEGHSRTGVCCYRRSSPSNRNPGRNDPIVVTRSRSNLEMLPCPPVPPVVIGSAHQRWRWRSKGSHHPSSLQRPVYRHHPPNICCIQGLAFVVLKMAWELTCQRWIRTINSKYIYGLVVGSPPPSPCYGWLG